MFVSVRHYRLREGSMDDLARRVDETFADQISSQPGFVSYEFLDCGDGEVMTVSVFQTEEEAEASRELAQRWTEEHLRDFRFTQLEGARGEVLVSRAAHEMLTPVHAGG
jgi:hypothetical protein